jgi:RHS repeat-associated protein
MGKSGTASDIISLPKGGGAVSGIGETFAPDLFTGTGNFTVPIALPSGRNGFQPQLSLVYSSGNGNGSFGLGWALSLPGVSRKTSKGVPRYGDDDVFVLSGTEELIAVATAPDGNIRYRPRTEGLFARISFLPSANAWKVRSKDGLISYYGDDPEDPIGAPAVVSDPTVTDGPAKVFAWKLVRTVDTFRNRIDYEYERDSRRTKDRHWDQLYLKRIRYIDFIDENNNERFLVSVTFNYDPEDVASDTSTLDEVPERSDAFSDYRAGFEIRTRKRCKSIVVQTHADVARTVRVYELTYLDQRTAANPGLVVPANGVSLLSQIRVIGHDDEQPVEADRTQTLAPLEFGYTRFEPHHRTYVPLAGRSLPPRSLGHPDFEVADLFGNGLPDVFEMNGVARFWRNRGDGTFDIPREMADAPAGLQLSNPGVQLLDANGDGRVDLMVTAPGLSGFFSTTPEGIWDRRSFQRYRFAPSVGLDDPDIKLVDVDGDGVTDAVRSGTRFEIFFNDPRDGWHQTAVVDRGDVEQFPDVNFADPRVRWAEMSGDGVDDIVMVHSGSVEYWPHLGHCRFGKRLRMKNSPRFEDAAFFPGIGYDPKRLLVGDIDGDGLDDLVYVGSGDTTIWINQSGNAWSDPIVIHGTPLFSNIDDVRLVDMLGTGTAGVLWTYDFNAALDSTVKFLDFTGGVKPYLLIEMNNHMGAITRIEYASSTKFYLEDDQTPATRWQTSLPFPVHVVSRVEVVDEFSRGKLTTEYRYHHGYWDGAEREFRGFGRVDQTDTQLFDAYHEGGLHQVASFERVSRQHFSDPVETRTWFHLGPVGDEFGDWRPDDFAFVDVSGEFFSDDPSILSTLQAELPLSQGELDVLRQLPRRVRRDAIRTLRGHAIRTETYIRDASSRHHRPLTVTETLHGVSGVSDEAGKTRLVVHLDDLPAGWRSEPEARRVFFPHVIAQRTTQWERGSDPRTRFSFSDNYDEFGQSRQRTAIACPRNWKTLEDRPANAFLASKTEIVFAAPTELDTYIHNRVARVTFFEVTNDGANTVLELKAAADTGAALRVEGQTLNFFDGPAFVGLANGQTGAHAALVRAESLVLTEQILTNAYSDPLDKMTTRRIPWYLDPSGERPSASEYPTEFVAEIDDLPALAGFTLEPADQLHVGGYYASSARKKFDFQDAGTLAPRGLLMVLRDPLAAKPSDPEIGDGDGDTVMDYDAFDFLPVTVADPVNLTTFATYDLRVFQPHRVTDANGNRSVYEYTPLGLLKSIAVMGKDTETLGDTEDVPGTIFRYDLLAFDESDADARRPVSVHGIRRVHHVTDTDESISERDATIESREYSDGFGRLLQTRVLADDVIVGDPLFGDGVVAVDQSVLPGDIVLHERTSPLPNVLVSGDQRYNNKGQLVEKFEAYFDLGAGFEYRPATAAHHGQKVTLFYDALGRLIRTLNPDGSEQRVIFGVPGTIATPNLSTPDRFEPTPWEAYTYDGNDLAPLSREPSDDGTIGKSLGNRAPLHHHFTPSSVVFDALGRAVQSIARNRRAPEIRNAPLPDVEELRTRSVYNLRGNVIAVFDQLDRQAFAYVYDLAGTVLRVENIDAGVRRSIFDGAGNERERRDTKGGLTLHGYDRLSRPTRLWARDDADGAVTATLRERLEYGDGGAPNQDQGIREANRAVNRLGALHQHFDEAGLSEHLAYDFKGNVLEKRRRFIRDQAILTVFPSRDDSAPDWRIRAFRVDWDSLDTQEDTLLDEVAHETSAAFDALNRTRAVLYPRDITGQRQQLRPTYSRAGALQRVALDGATFVEHIAYNAKGQRTFVALANGVMSLYAYDPHTLRLARVVSTAYVKPDVHTFRPKALTTNEDRAAHLHQDFTYEYDLVGNLMTLRDRTPGSGVPKTVRGTDALDRVCTYDAIYRLLSATGRECDTPAELPFDTGPRCADLTRTRQYSEQYEYDGLGNLQELHHTIVTTQRNTNGFVRRFELQGDSNRLRTMRVGQTPVPYRYDRNGNVTDETTSRHFEWDHSDRLKVFRVQTDPAREDEGPAEPTVYAHYLYDAAGMRLKKLVRKQGGIVETTEYVHALFERHRSPQGEADTLIVSDDRKRLASKRVGEPLAGDTTPPVKYELQDHLGSSNVVLDVDGGLINREEYTPYGETSFGSFARKRYRFTGTERDEESGLNYHGARYYASYLARWISTDPVDQPESLNLYLYAMARPLARVDTSGGESEAASLAQQVKTALKEAGAAAVAYGKVIAEHKALSEHPAFKDIALREFNKLKNPSWPTFQKNVSKSIKNVLRGDAPHPLKDLLEIGERATAKGPLQVIKWKSGPFSGQELELAHNVSIKEIERYGASPWLRVDPDNLTPTGHEFHRAHLHAEQHYNDFGKDPQKFERFNRLYKGLKVNVSRAAGRAYRTKLKILGPSGSLRGVAGGVALNVVLTKLRQEARDAEATTLMKVLPKLNPSARDIDLMEGFGYDFRGWNRETGVPEWEYNPGFIDTLRNMQDWLGEYLFSPLYGGGSNEA